MQRKCSDGVMISFYVIAP